MEILFHKEQRCSFLLLTYVNNKGNINLVMIMVRQNKSKKIGKMPEYRNFHSERESDLEIQLSLEEYETIRLIDYLGYNQQRCSEEMGVSRSTIVSLYNNARKKIARFLIEGHGLQIDGGHYHIQQKKGEKNMKIAVTCVNGQVFQHFGHCPSFLICDVEEGKLVSSTMVDSSSSGCGALAGFLADLGVNVVICGGIGAGAKNHLAASGLQVLPGASGDALAQVESYIAGTLNYDPDSECNHHGHDENHQCHGHHQCH